jgi:hypothetical protein
MYLVTLKCGKTVARSVSSNEPKAAPHEIILDSSSNSTLLIETLGSGV